MKTEVTMMKVGVLALALAGVAPAQDLFQSDPPSLGGVLFPHLHGNAAVGDSTRDPADLAAHGHDPNDQFTLQGIDLGASLRYGEYLRGFANYRVFRDLDDDWDGEWEEAFAKLDNLPGGFELRGGRLLNRVGRQNAVHLHGWDFVDANLITSRMLGEEGLRTNSGEITWNLPVPLQSVLSVSFGDAVSHDHHGHGGDHGDHDDHDDDDHDDDDDDDHDDDDHGGIEGEEAGFDTNVITGRLDVLWGYNDFHQFRFGGSVVTGDNMFGRTTTAGGLDVEYLWRENGLAEGGRSLRWLTEIMAREVEYVDEDSGRRGDDRELGLVTAVFYGFADHWEAGLRYGWLEGSNELDELPERHRWSAALTRRTDFGCGADGFARLQYNHDKHDDYGGEDSVWFQIGLNWGGPEVR